MIIRESSNYKKSYKKNLVNNHIYEEIKNNYGDNSFINDISKNNNIPLSFIYSRLAYEGMISYKSKEYNESIEKIF